MLPKKELWLLLAAFILPIVLGSAFFYANPDYFTKKTINYGRLINPIIITDERDIVFAKNTKASVAGIWSLVYVSNKCEAECLKIINEMKTIRLLLNQQMRRLQRILLTNDTDINGKQGDLLIARASAKLQKKLSAIAPNGLFLIDPIGNIMLYYDSQNLNTRQVLKDLERLFKYSRIG